MIPPKFTDFPAKHVGFGRKKDFFTEQGGFRSTPNGLLLQHQYGSHLRTGGERGSGATWEQNAVNKLYKVGGKRDRGGEGGSRERGGEGKSEREEKSDT